MARATATSEPSVVGLAELTDDLARRRSIGSTARQLLRLHERGVALADAWVIPTYVFRRVVAASVASSQDPESVLGDIERLDGPRRAAEAAEAICAASVPASLRAELAALTRGDARFTVHASPTLKDDALVQAAGLDVVRGPFSERAALEDAIRRIWALAFDERVLVRLRHERVHDLAMAVLVARIPARAVLACAFSSSSERGIGPRAICVTDALLAGLAMPNDPGAPRTWLLLEPGGRRVERTLGAALEALPQIVGWRPGEPAPDLRRAGRSIRPPRELVPNLGSLVVSDELALTISNAVLAGEALDGPVRCLVAVGGDRVDTLATHRVAAAPSPEGSDEDSIWSQALIGDGVPAVPTPMSASLYSGFESVAARATSALFGARTPRGASFLGSVNGRLCLNESLLAAIARRGVSQDERVITELDGTRSGYVAADPSLLALSMAFTRVYAIEQGLDLEMQRFERDADAYFRWLAEMDLGILPDDGVTTTLLEARHHLFTAWQMRITALGVVSTAAHAVRRVLERRLGSDALRISHMLEGGAAALPTTLYSRALHHVAAIAASDPEARAAIGAGGATLDALPDGAGRRALTSFLSAYGEYAPCAAELGIARFREREAVLIALLRACFEGTLDDLDPIVASGRAAVAREIADVESRLPFFERRMFAAALPRLNRVAMLADRATRLQIRAAAALRAVLVDVDRRLERREPTLHPGSVFYCRFDELVSLLEKPPQPLAVLVRQRRAAWERIWQRARPPSRFVGAARIEPPARSGTTRGIGSGRGVARGAVRRVTAHDPTSVAAVRSGDVVVTAALDPALVPLLFVASAIVTERGSAWTSGLPLARECGIPVVVATGDAAQRWIDGSEVEVDAVAATVDER